MRTLTSTLTAAQIARSIEPLWRLALTKDAASTTYNEDRILSVDHLEEPFHGAATVVLDNSDLAVTTSFIGYQGVLSYGAKGSAGDERSACAPMHVTSQVDHSSEGVLTVTLTLQGLADELSDDRASKQHTQLSTDLSTIKDLLTQVVKAILPDWAAATVYALDALVIPATQNDLAYKCTVAGTSHATTEPTFPTTIGGTVVDNTVTWTCIGKEITAFSHCRAYTPTFDSEDSVFDVFNPADSFSLALNTSRLDAIEKLLRYTKNVMRVEADGAIHFRQPVVSGAVYDNEYKLDVNGAHDIFAKANRKVLLNPNYIVVTSHPDDGNGFTGSAEDTGSSDLTNMEKREHYYVRAGSSAECASLAAAILEKYQSSQQKGAALVPLHCGQEVHDYINFTDARNNDTRAGNIGTIRRVCGEGKFEMQIALGDIRQGGFLGMAPTRNIDPGAALGSRLAAIGAQNTAQLASIGAQSTAEVNALGKAVSEAVATLRGIITDLIAQVNSAFSEQYSSILGVQDIAQYTQDVQAILINQLIRGAYLNTYERPSNQVIGSLAEIVGTAPKLRRTETDQVDPAGRFQDRVDGDVWYFERAKTALWATSQELLKLEPVANRVTLGNGGGTLTLLLGAIAAGAVLVALPVDSATLSIRGASSPYKPELFLSTSAVGFKTGNSGESALLTRLSLSTNVTTSIATWSNTHHTGFIADGVGGRGNQNMAISGNDTVTDATARRITLDVLDPATDTRYFVAQAVPKAATPLFIMRAPDYTPTTGELDDEFITFSYVKSTNTLSVHRNEGGAIVSAVVAVLA